MGQYDAPPSEGKTRYWTSWWTGAEGDWPATSWRYWISGETFDEPPRFSLVALIDAGDEASVWRDVQAYFPDAEARFCEVRMEDTLAILATGGRFT